MPYYVFNLFIKLLMAFWNIQSVFSNFLFLQVDIRDKDGLEKVFASTR
jgi:UDP-glucose 4-epimerase